MNNGSKMLLDSSVMASMSGFFMSAGRSGMKETQTSEMTSPVTPEVLEPIIDFINNGKITLSLDGAPQLVMTAIFLQMDPLLKICIDYILKRVHLIPGHCFMLVLDFGVEQLEEATMSFVCDKLYELIDDEDFASKTNFRMLQCILTSDELNVPSEDEVVKIINKWNNAYKREVSQVLSVLAFVRLPYLTPECARELRITYPDISKLEVCRTMQTDDWTMLPVEQLTRRKHYATHVHLLYRDLYLEPKDTSAYVLCCCRVHKNKVIGNSQITHFKEVSVGERYQFAIVGDTLLKCTSNKQDTKLMIFSIGEDREFVLRGTFNRDNPFKGFALAADGDNCVLSYFEGLFDPPKFVACNIKTWNVDKNYFEPKTNMIFNPSCMVFSEDFVVLLRNTQLFVYNRTTKEMSDVNIPEKLGWNKLTDMVRMGDSLYVYEDRKRKTDARAESSEYDRVHVFDLLSKEWRNTCLMTKRIFGGGLQDHNPGHLRKLLVINEELHLIAQEDGMPKISLLRFNESLGKFEVVCNIQSYDFRVGSPSKRRVVLTRKFLLSVPIHVHSCRHETWLQYHCRNLDKVKDADLIKRLAACI